MDSVSGRHVNVVAWVAFMWAMMASASAASSPFERFNEPVSMFWWKASCKDAYVTNPDQGYAKGYCHGVLLAYMNELDEWCVPDGTPLPRVEDHIIESVIEAEIDSMSLINIGDWIQDAVSVKWPC